MNNRNLKKKILFWILGIVHVIAIAVGMWMAYEWLRQKPDKNVGNANDDVNEAGKNVTINVVDEDGNVSMYNVVTKEDYLEGVMNEADGLTYETADGMVMIVNGQRADYVKDGAYWSFYVNGAYCNYGIKEQPVNDGDVFEIRYTRA